MRTSGSCWYVATVVALLLIAGAAGAQGVENLAALGAGGPLLSFSSQDTAAPREGGAPRRRARRPDGGLRDARRRAGPAERRLPVRLRGHGVPRRRARRHARPAAPRPA